MIKDGSNQQTGSRFVNQFGYYTAISMTVITLVTFGIAFFTPPLSGPFCPGSCFEYPYADIAARFPRDYIWMYFAIVLNLVFILLTSTIHRHASGSGKLFSQIGLSFAIPSAGILVSNYFLQVTVIQPSVLNGETDGIALLTQFNPHGLFIALEEIGFLLMSLAFLSIAFVFQGSDRLEKALRWIFILGFILAIVSLVWITMVHGVHREYFFEVAAITINWTVLIVTGILLAIWFRKNLRTP